jgi:hypothetical protein
LLLLLLLCGQRSAQLGLSTSHQCEMQAWMELLGWKAAAVPAAAVWPPAAAAAAPTEHPADQSLMQAALLLQLLPRWVLLPVGLS